TELKRFPDEVLAAMREQSELVLGELAAQSELNGRIWASMKAFQAQAEPMHEISEKELYNCRCVQGQLYSGREPSPSHPAPLPSREGEHGPKGGARPDQYAAYLASMVRCSRICCS